MEYELVQWDMAVVNARKDMNSDLAALYVETLNEVTNLHWLRVAVGVQARIPTAIWLVLLALVALGMMGSDTRPALQVPGEHGQCEHGQPPRVGLNAFLKPA